MTIKYAKIVNEKTKACQVGLGTDSGLYRTLGMIETDVEQAYDGNWYVKGYAPQEPAKSYTEKRLAEYPALGEQLDMIYWDKVNGTNLWQQKITEIKTKYPKG
ncbi:MAG: hypothetical protein IJV07_03455 [Alphaproteobacteria bacterium]|nr:hypothetical protein [Alphaproteobacteria bacterium]